MDGAFLDRVDIKFHIPPPTPLARYEILRQRLLALGSSDLLTGHSSRLSSAYSDLSDSSHNIFSDSTALSSWLPPYPTFLLRYSDVDGHPAKLLWEISEKCDLVSGRTLQRLPVLAMVLHTTEEPCGIDEMMIALAAAVDQELKGNERDEMKVTK